MAGTFLLGSLADVQPVEITAERLKATETAQSLAKMATYITALKDHIKDPKYLAPYVISSYKTVLPIAERDYKALYDNAFNAKVAQAEIYSDDPAQSDSTRTASKNLFKAWKKMADMILDRHSTMMAGAGLAYNLNDALELVVGGLKSAGEGIASGVGAVVGAILSPILKSPVTWIVGGGIGYYFVRKARR